MLKREGTKALEGVGQSTTPSVDMEELTELRDYKFNTKITLDKLESEKKEMEGKLERIKNEKKAEQEVNYCFYYKIFTFN